MYQVYVSVMIKLHVIEMVPYLWVYATSFHNIWKTFNMFTTAAMFKVMELGYGKFENSDVIRAGGFVNHPLSVGTVRLSSDKPSDPPLIDTCYLEHPDDMKTMLESKE